MTNERLRTALARAAQGVEDVAHALQVDPKTVQRWLTGRTPHPRHRAAVAELLSLDEAYLWPDARSLSRDTRGGAHELVALYPHRSAVPTELWLELLSGTRQCVDVLAYAALFLPELDPRLTDTLREKADAGVSVRLALGDPDSAAVRLRGEEEGIGAGMSARVALTLAHLGDLATHPGIELHRHGTTLYNSIFRFDDEMLINAHVYGTKAYENPVLHLRRTADGPLFGSYARSFDRVWATSASFAA